MPLQTTALLFVLCHVAYSIPFLPFMPLPPPPPGLPGMFPPPPLPGLPPPIPGFPPPLPGLPPPFPGLPPLPGLPPVNIPFGAPPAVLPPPIVPGGIPLGTPAPVVAVPPPVLAPAPQAPPAAPLIQISPPTLNVAPNQERCPLKIKLSRKPVGPVSIYMEAANFAFSSCELKFDETSWSVEQTLEAIPLPYFTGATVNREIEATFKIAALKDKEMNKNELKYKMVRDKGTAAICQSFGDPHYLGFNGMRYDFLTGVGNYYLVKSDFLTIQTQTKVIVAGPTWNEAVAIRFGKTVYIVHSTNGISLASASKEGIEVIESPDKKDFHFKLADGSEVKASIKFIYAPYVDVTVELAEHGKGKVNGLCGKWVDGDQKFYGPDNQLDMNVMTWGMKWTVPANDDIFQCRDQCQGAIDKGYQTTTTAVCKIPTITDVVVEPPVRPPPGDYEPCDPPKYDPVPPPPAPPTPPPPPKQCTEEHKAKCKELCTKVIKHPYAEKYLDPAPYVATCIEDCGMLGTFDVVDVHKNNYFIKLRSIEKTIVADTQAAEVKFQATLAASEKKAYGVKVEAPPKEVKIQLEKLHVEVNTLRATFGLGSTTCPSNDEKAVCSGNGSCRTSGCCCKQGFTGLDCSVKIAEAGYTAKKEEVLTDKVLVLPPPKPLPACPEAAKAATVNAALILKEIPAVSVAIVKTLKVTTTVKTTMVEQ